MSFNQQTRLEVAMALEALSFVDPNNKDKLTERMVDLVSLFGFGLDKDRKLFEGMSTSDTNPRMFIAVMVLLPAETLRSLVMDARFEILFPVHVLKEIFARMRFSDSCFFKPSFSESLFYTRIINKIRHRDKDTFFMDEKCMMTTFVDWRGMTTTSPMSYGLVNCHHLMEAIRQANLEQLREFLTPSLMGTIARSSRNMEIITELFLNHPSLVADMVFWTSISFHMVGDNTRNLMDLMLIHNTSIDLWYQTEYGPFIHVLLMIHSFRFVRDLTLSAFPRVSLLDRECTAKSGSGVISRTVEYSFLRQVVSKLATFGAVRANYESEIVIRWLAELNDSGRINALQDIDGRGATVFSCMLGPEMDISVISLAHRLLKVDIRRTLISQCAVHKGFPFPRGDGMKRSHGFLFVASKYCTEDLYLFAKNVMMALCMPGSSQEIELAIHELTAKVCSIRFRSTLLRCPFETLDFFVRHARRHAFDEVFPFIKETFIEQFLQRQEDNSQVSVSVTSKSARYHSILHEIRMRTAFCGLCSGNDDSVLAELMGRQWLLDTRVFKIVNEFAKDKVAERKRVVHCEDE